MNQYFQEKSVCMCACAHVHTCVYAYIKRANSLTGFSKPSKYGIISVAAFQENLLRCNLFKQTPFGQ